MGVKTRDIPSTWEPVIGANQPNLDLIDDAYVVWGDENDIVVTFFYWPIQPGWHLQFSGRKIDWYLVSGAPEELLVMFTTYILTGDQPDEHLRHRGKRND